MAKTKDSIENVLFNKVIIKDPFFSPKINKVQSVTIKACIQKSRETGRISNFQKAAGLMEGEFEGTFYNDSDVYKVLEGIAYALMINKDKELEKDADEIINYIEAAQEKDGYIQTYFTLVKPDQKWTDMNMHEDYCIGHLIEAGIAYKQATGKTTLYNVGKKAADLMVEKFGPSKSHWVSGHQEIELALVKLYNETKNKDYLNLAEFILEERGKGFGRGYSWDREGWGAIYNQDHETVREMKDAKGHSVRALYMYCGITDIAKEMGNSDYLKTIDTLWDSVVNRNMYITGGVGSSHENEGFTYDYDLPNLTAYCETCASIAMVYWNQRLNLLYGNSKYADIVEKEIYNGVMSGISLSGDKFFYDNPLESLGEYHRVEWFTCSCCPTQLSRFIPSIGNYIYMKDEKGIFINQYISSETTLSIASNDVNILINGNYPFMENVEIKVESKNKANYKIRLRKPSWCERLEVKINNQLIDDYFFENGYLVLEREWGLKDIINLKLYMPIQVQISDPNVVANVGKVAIQKGPVIYCFESVDNKNYDKITFKDNSTFSSEFKKDLLDGVDIVKMITDGEAFVAVPYFAWDNREKGAMKVWIDKK